MKIKSHKVTFAGGRGHILDARLEMPFETPKAYAIFCHCFTCTKDTITTFRISRALAGQGYGVLRFDFTGLGSSKGKFADTNFSTNVADILAATDYLRSQYQAPLLLLGHSLGGTAVLKAALRSPEVSAVVTIASPSQPSHVLHHFGHSLALLEQGNSIELEVAGKFYDVDPQFLADLKKYDMKKELANMTKPALIFSIANDVLVNYSNATELDSWISGHTTMITLNGTDHLLSEKQKTAYVADEIVKWFERLPE